MPSEKIKLLPLTDEEVDALKAVITLLLASNMASKTGNAMTRAWWGQIVLPQLEKINKKLNK